MSAVTQPRGRRAILAFWSGWGQGWRSGFAAGKASCASIEARFLHQLLAMGVSPEATRAVAARYGDRCPCGEVHAEAAS